MSKCKTGFIFKIKSLLVTMKKKIVKKKNNKINYSIIILYL